MLGFGKKKDVYDQVYGKSAEYWRSYADEPVVTETDAATPRVEQAAYQSQQRYSYDDGSKWQGAFGPTEFLITDYWTLRARSVQLFETNHYARGIIRTLITNELNTGLQLEVVPEESILGKEEDELLDWAETVENRFGIWANEPGLCDTCERSTFGALQVAARMEALIAGDVLVVLRQDQRTGLPRIQLFSGSVVQSPLSVPQAGNRIVHGVELDPQGRQVAYWVMQRAKDGSLQRECKRLPAYGEKSGRRLAWLVYGTDKKLDDVRGKPLLSLILQSLKEIDRYRDSVQRKAVINSMLAMFIQKDVERMGSKPMAGAAVKRGTQVEIASDGTPRRFAIAEQIPGLVLDELQVGEVPHGFPANGTDEKFGSFELAILQSIAWSIEIPPEILTRSFNSNYSASQAAINEFKMTLNRVRNEFGDAFCHPIYREWLLAEVLSQRINADGLLEAWRDPLKYDIYGAWTASDWTGQIKPAVDQSKLAGGYVVMINEGLITRRRAARELNGTKFSKNVQRLEKENAALAVANTPLSELANPQFPASAAATAKPPVATADELDQADGEPATKGKKEDN